MASQRGYQSVSAAKKEYKFWFTFLSALFSAAPLVSLIQRAFNVGLAPILSEALQYYRRVVYPLVEAMQYILSYLPWIDIYTILYSLFISPELYKDLVALSFMSAMVVLRVITHIAVGTEYQKRRFKDPMEYLAIGIGMTFIGIILFCLGFTLVALLFPVYAVYSALRYWHMDNSLYITYLISLAIAFVACGAFYVTNELLR